MQTGRPILSLPNSSQVKRSQIGAKFAGLMGVLTRDDIKAGKSVPSRGGPKFQPPKSEGGGPVKREYPGFTLMKTRER